jgi:hypothetical protein
MASLAESLRAVAAWKSVGLQEEKAKTDRLLAVMQMEYAANQQELAFQRNVYLTDRKELSELETSLALIGQLPEQDRKKDSIAAISKMTAGELTERMEDTGSRISELKSITSKYQAGIKDVKGFQSRFADIIEDEKDEAARYMITGSLEIDPETGAPVGSEEWEKILDKLKGGTKAEQLEYEKFRDEAYIGGIESSLRTAEDALKLQASKEAIDTANLQQQAAETAINANQFALFQAKNEEFETITGEIFKQQALDYTAQFRYGEYSMMDLVALGADNPGELIDIKQDFAEAYPDIAHDADKFLSGIQSAQAAGVDPSRFVVEFYAKAYEDFLLLDEYKAELAAEGEPLDLSYDEMYDNLPTQSATKLEIDRLVKKVSGFKTLGVYGEGKLDELNHMYAVTKMYDTQQMMRLTADVKEHEQVAGYGLQLDPIESYYPEHYEYMEPEAKIELERSLAFISASGGDPPLLGEDPDIASFIQDIKETELGEETEREEYKAVSDEYRYALSGLRYSDPGGHTFKTMIDDMFKEGMLQGAASRHAPGAQISEGHHFTKKEMAAIKKRVTERARVWREGGGGLFGKGPNDAIALLQLYQRFEDAWKEFDPLWQERKDAKQQIMDSLGRI